MPFNIFVYVQSIKDKEHQLNMDIEVITSKDFDDSDLGEIKQLFFDKGFDIGIDNVRMIRESMVPPPAIWIDLIIGGIVGVAVTAFFTGFFNRMGVDAYDNFKQIVKKILEKRKRDELTQLRIHVKKGQQRIIIPIPDDIEKQEQALDALPEFLDKNSDIV